MALVEPMRDNSPATPEGSTMHGGKFMDKILERQYGVFKLEYYKPAVFIFIIQLLWLNIGGIITSCVHYSSGALPHIIIMAVFAIVNITLTFILQYFRRVCNIIVLSFLIIYALAQICADAILCPYVLSTVTSLPWLLVAMVTSYKTLPLSFIMCLSLSALDFIVHSLVVTLFPGAQFERPGFAISNALGSNTILILCVNIIGIIWSFRTDQRLRKAFTESRSSQSVNLLIEESTREQERLLLSVLPKHVASEMLKDWGTEVGGQFRKIYMNRHEDVSILFADIVGFTAMSSLVTPSELVQILNDLFANFDKLADKFHQLRIKILGDCYYSISGCPEPRPDHAVLCIHMGLAMVSAIGEVRKKTGSGVNMRVGIHTGAVLAGVMGQQRWQYDVLGKEVTFANKMESGGLPGRVHISETTASFLSGEFELEPGDGETREEAIRLAAMKTYLVKSIIKPYPQGTLDDNSHETSTLEKIEISGEEMKGPGSKKQLTNKSFGQASVPCNIITLRFHDTDLEKAYSGSLSNDLDLAVSLICPVLVVVASLLAQVCVLPFTLSCLLTFLVPFVITGVVAIIPFTLRYPKRFTKIIRNLSESSITKPVGRHVVVAVLMVVMVTADMADLHVCASSWQPNNSTNLTHPIANTTSCNFPVFFCNSILLILLTVHLQYQVSYLSRAFLLAVITALTCALYNTTVQSAFHDYDVIIESFRDNEDYISSSTYFTIMLSVICVFLTISSRNCESQHRRLFIFRQQLKENHAKIDILQEKNKALIYNILPAHVARHFTGTKRKDEDLYSQQYSEVGVMFASCPNFNDHYTEDAINNHGVEWMRLLNEIISDYDDLLNDQRFASIVKIKTIGPTYMVASGLNFAQPVDGRAPIVERWRHLADLVEFALALKESLDRINSQSFNHFMLRIGINHGPILAGVIGARKPHYDIWGNSVNVASRMESTGKLGEIQVVEETMLILKEFGYTFSQRGLVKVKGKGDLMTYFLTGRQVPPSA